MPTHISASETARTPSLLSRITRHLATLNTLNNELVHALAHTRPTVEKVSERGRVGIPLNIRVVELRDDIKTVLAGWAALVCEERRVPTPPPSTAELARFLTGHAEWLADHPAGEDLATETQDLIGAAWSMLSGRDERTIVVGGCPRPQCTGSLVATMNRTGTRSGAHVVCSADTGHTWTPAGWHRLRAEAAPATPAPGRAAAPRARGRQDTTAGHTTRGTGTGHTPRDTAAGLTARDIAAGWGIAPGTVYWLANTHRWGRRKQARTVLYNRDDVLATMDARAGDSPHPTAAAR
ncbi:hypothetical protein [Streptomyces sp. NPDC058326]|uniref:hypothetical protein n=1 Tax=Streptomyces sp. NPDC058326 TaxID=3346447 RepID=UPI0036E20573